MSLLPERSDADEWREIEYLFWSRIPNEHYGKVLNNLDELKEIFPDIRAEEERKDFTIFYTVVEVVDLTQYMAYGCGLCDKIIMQPPRMETESSISGEYPLSGREGIDYYCINCNEQIHEDIFRMS